MGSEYVGAFIDVFHDDDWKNSQLYQNYIRQFKDIGVDLVFYRIRLAFPLPVCNSH